MVITSLMDDYCPRRGLQGEHGLSLLIETGGKRLLFAAGQGPAFMGNARVLGMDLSSIDAVILSHGHYDHGGGLRSLYEAFGDSAPPFFTGRDFDCYRYSRGKDGLREIGIRRPVLPTGSAKAIAITSLEPLAQSIFILPAVDRVDGTPYSKRFVRRMDGTESLDEFDDELSLVFDTPSGLAVVAGCAHRGIVNILDAARMAFPERPLAAVIGGFHLVDASEEEMDITARAIAACSPGLVACSHCTGLKGFSALYRAMPGNTVWLACGMTVEV